MLLKSHFSYLMVNFLKQSDVIKIHDDIPLTGLNGQKDHQNSHVFIMKNLQSYWNNISKILLCYIKSTIHL